MMILERGYDGKVKSHEEWHAGPIDMILTENFMELDGDHGMYLD